jgi:hypothetical protein
MKWIKTAISGQNLYLKLAIFIIGVATGLDSSLRQLLSQIALFLVFLLLEPRLYCHMLSALRRILPFFAGYWLFATLFSQSYPVSIRFSIQIIYLVLVTVAVFGGVRMCSLAWDSRWIRRFAWVNAMFYYVFATWLYVRSFFHHYRLRQATYGSEPVSILIKEVFNAVVEETERIRARLQEIMAYQKEESHLPGLPNVIGVLFLASLVVVNGL